MTPSDEQIAATVLANGGDVYDTALLGEAVRALFQPTQEELEALRYFANDRYFGHEQDCDCDGCLSAKPLRSLLARFEGR